TAPRIKLDAGPSISQGPNTSPMIRQLLIAAAEQSGARWQTEPSSKRESNDADKMQLADGGSAAASLGIPIRNMHTQTEVASLRDVEWSADILTAFVSSLRADTELRPLV